MIGWLELECACTHPGCDRRLYTSVPVTTRRASLDGQPTIVLTLPDIPRPALCRTHSAAAQETP